MTLQNDLDVAATREKLAILEAHYEDLRLKPDPASPVRRAKMQSLKDYINQFKEEIARYEAQHPACR